MQRVFGELRMMVGTGTLELHVESMRLFFEKLNLLQIVPCTKSTLKRTLLRDECVSACGTLE